MQFSSPYDASIVIYDRSEEPNFCRSKLLLGTYLPTYSYIPRWEYLSDRGIFQNNANFSHAQFRSRRIGPPSPS